jgi:hypothetical protein
MSLGQQLTRLRAPLRLHRRAVRWRLTRLYGGLFLAAGAGLLAVTYLLVAASPGKYAIQGRVTGRGGPGHNPPGAGFLHSPAAAQAQAAQQHAADMTRSKSAVRAAACTPPCARPATITLPLSISSATAAARFCLDDRTCNTTSDAGNTLGNTGRQGSLHLASIGS